MALGTLRGVTAGKGEAGETLRSARSYRAPQLIAGMARRRTALGSRHLLRDPAARHDLAVHGYHVTGQVIGRDAIELLLEGCDAWLTAGEPLDGQFRSSYATMQEPAGMAARRCVTQVLLPALSPLVADDTWLRPSVFQVKPAHPDSGLRLHQDRALVDESTSYALHAWVALTDVSLDHGPLVVVPGSHRFCGWTRVATDEDPLARYQDVLERKSVALPVRAGQVIWFDAALLHGSLVNRSSDTRIGVSAVASHARDRVVIAGAVAPGGRSAMVYEHEASAVVRDTALPVDAGRPVGRVELDDLRFEPRTLGAVATAYRILHPGAPRSSMSPGA